jgi:hypothetical protein
VSRRRHCSVLWDSFTDMFAAQAAAAKLNRRGFSAYYIKNHGTGLWEVRFEADCADVDSTSFSGSVYDFQYRRADDYLVYEDPRTGRTVRVWFGDIVDIGETCRLWHSGQWSPCYRFTSGDFSPRNLQNVLVELRDAADAAVYDEEDKDEVDDYLDLLSAIESLEGILGRLGRAT